MTAKYPLKLITWHDAYNGNHDWFKAEKLSTKDDPYVVKTLGFEVLRTENHVTLAMSVTDNDNICDLFTIPLAIVVKEQTFRERN